MATFSAVMNPAGSTEDVKGSVNATSASAEILIGANRLFAINADGDVNISFGRTGMGAATGNNFRIPSGVVATYDLGDTFTHVRLFNAGGSAVNYWIQFLSRNA